MKKLQLGACLIICLTAFSSATPAIAHECWNIFNPCPSSPPPVNPYCGTRQDIVELYCRGVDEVGCAVNVDDEFDIIYREEDC